MHCVLAMRLDEPAVWPARRNPIDSLRRMQPLERISMINANPRLAAYGLIFSLLVAAGIAYAFFGEHLGIRTVYHAPASSSAPMAK